VAHHAGRHRAPGRLNPLSELTGILARSAAPAVKTSAVLAASGGLVAAFAVPSQAAQAAPAEKPQGNPAAAAVAVKVPAAPAPAAQNAFGVIGFTATAKPKPKPKPAPRPAPAPEPEPAPAPAPEPQRSEQAASRSVERTPLKPATGGILGIAAQYKGIMYRYGGTTPSGFDCSGYTSYVFRQVGISLPRTAEDQRRAATPVANPQPGDLVFFGAPATHVGIYAGNGQMWDSPRTGKAVDLRDIWSSDVTYGRP
jgi:cell wall-associated NlpC family hydrolase